MSPKTKNIYKLEEFSQRDILYNSIGLIIGFLFILFGDWISAGFCILAGGFISLHFLEIDNCYEVLTCKFNPALNRIILEQSNLLSHGVLTLELGEIENVIIQSRDSSFNFKTRFTKNLHIDNQVFWIVVISSSGEHYRLTYYETSFIENKQKIVDYILELKNFN